MQKSFNRARVRTETVGTGDVIALGDAVSDAFNTFAEAGASDGDVTTIVVEQGTDYAIYEVVIGDEATTATIVDVYMSKINGVHGTERLDLNGTAEIRCSETAEDLNYLRYNPYIDAVKFGLVGDGVQDDTDAMNALFAGGNKHIYFPAGTYYLTNPVRMQANTKVLCHPLAVFHCETNSEANNTFLNGIYQDDSYATGYDGDGNIVWKGGRFTFTEPLTTTRSQAFGIGHAKNVWIIGVEFDGWTRSHVIELNAVAESGVLRCRFLNEIYDTGDENMEAIQIDAANAGNFPAFGSADETPCRDILISGNYFENVEAGVGNHSGELPFPVHRNIRIVNNTIRGCKTVGIQPRHFYDSLVAGNHIEDVGGRGIRVIQSPRTIVSGNTILNCGHSGVSAVFFNTSEYSVFDSSNIVWNDGSKTLYTRAVEIGPNGTTAEGVVIDTSGCKPGSAGMFANNGVKSTVNGATQYTIADDGVAVIPITTHRQQGIVIINMHSNASTSPRGLYWVAVATPTISEIAKVTAADVNTTTGVLSGTTGVDGKVTISVHTDGNLYIENRAGATMRVDVKFIGI